MTTHLPLDFSTHSFASIFLSSTVRDMPSPVVPFTAGKKSLAFLATMADNCAICEMVKKKIQSNKGTMDERRKNVEI